ncbi:MAG: hypothetical protein KF847_08235 [Pirellulales bacterium]|nr:hypothetical protein [Pirellulales bacterium]
MHPPSRIDELSPEQRRREIASILAKGILRLRARAALPTNAPCKSPKTGAEGLEVPDKTVLSVPRG